MPFLRVAEDRHFWFRARNDVIATLLRQLEPAFPQGYRAIELGCGTGNTLRVLADECRRGRVFGIDFQREGLQHARQRVGPRVVQADVQRSPFSPSLRFDLIGMFDVLEHVDDDCRVLADIRSWLTDAGMLMLTVPASPALWSAFDVAAHHRRRYTAEELESKLTGAGFRVEYLSPFMVSLYPLAWIKRRFHSSRIQRDPFAAVIDDLRIVPVVNGALEWLLSRELRPIAARRRLPFGVSLIAIARR